ncbi:acyltransferase [Leptolyngbya sp. ST-U4]|uniref:acyltransferase n=1 Tax=Leptolyngbya sp. ST-U4 TaxID=2933912 RepID=UPI0019C9A217|nr:acyltransferase [Cyanobacteria bacterium FACHB-502]
MNQKSLSQGVLPKKAISYSVDRLFCLDLLKAASILSVVSFHAIFVPRSAYQDSLFFLDIASAPLRFCVPVLFTISFLLFERGIEHSAGQPDWQILKKRISRLAIPTLFWFSLAVILKLSTGRNSFPDLLLAVANGTIFQGAYYFLVLFQMMPLLILCRRRFKYRKAVGFIIALQTIIFLLIYFILARANQFSALLSSLEGVGRPFLIYWLVYGVLGIYLWQHWSKLVERSRRIPISVKLAFLGVGVLLVLVERSIFFTISNGDIPPFDYNLLICILMTPIIFLCAASIKQEQLPEPVSNCIMLVSRYSLGIFCINGIASEIFLSVGSRVASGFTFSLAEILLIKLIGWTVLFLLSLRLSILLDRIGLGAIVR